MIAALCARYLERLGHVVLEPDFLISEDVFANVGPFTVVRGDAPYRIVPAATQLLPLGCRAVPANARILPPGAAIRRPERSPDVGTTHTPMRVQAKPRTVTGIMGDEVTYRTATTERTVKVGTFNDWRRDTGAVESRG